jgi:hypothetical protein
MKSLRQNLNKKRVGGDSFFKITSSFFNKNENQMKKIFIFLGLLGFLATGCSDYLEEENLSNVVVDNYYKSTEGFETLVNATYSSLRDIYGPAPWMFSAGTDMYAEGRQSQPVGLSEYRFLTPSEDEVLTLYENCYSSIQACNIGLQYSTITEEFDALNQRIGEMRFIRANAYFLLVQSYGGVALVTEMIDEPVTELNRESAETIYDFIINELGDARNMVSTEAYIGRVNRRAVTNLLAKVHLTRGYETFGSDNDFTTAASLADEVINGQALTIPFHELWWPGNEMNEEVIFSVQYSENSISSAPTELGHSQASYFGPYMGGNERAGDASWRSYNLLPTMYLLDLYNENDVRWDGTFMSTVYEPYYAFYRQEDHSSLDVMHYYARPWESNEAFETAYLSEHPEAAFHYYETLAPSKSLALDYQTIAIRKFDDPNSLFSSDGTVSTRDLILARVAETYLVAAEAYLQLENTQIAADRINEVRQRAGVVDIASGDVDIDLLLDERACELAGEYYRWFDLKRTGTLIDRAVMYNDDIESADWFVGKGGELKILRPIPQDALDLNRGDYPQNPAYD